MKRLALLASLAALFWAASASAELPYPVRDFRDLSDRKISDQGEAALRIDRESWKHAESENFIYHFTDAKEAETVLVHAEIFYSWVKEMFGVKNPPKSRKSHVFIFNDEKVWEDFRHRGTLEPITGAEAFTDGNELFICRMKFWLEPQRVLAHELAHVVLFRFLNERVPLYLNEGYAELMGFKAIAMKFDGNEYAVHTIQKMKPAAYVPLEKLAAIRVYPKGIEETAAFYLQSQFFVRFLMEKYGAPKFYEFLKSSVESKSLGYSLRQVYGRDTREVEEAFKEFAVEKLSR